MTGQGKSAIDTLLAESFKELTLKQPIEKITIKEITDKAGVIRPTFYNHFQDKYELLEWIITKELLEPIEPLVQNGMVSEALVVLFSNIEKEKEFYSKAVKLEGQNSFGSIAQQSVEQILRKVFENAAKRPSMFSNIIPFTDLFSTIVFAKYVLSRISAPDSFILTSKKCFINS